MINVAILTQRSSGILLHPSSLPGRYGIGGFGPESTSFLDFLAAAGQSLWQMLPLTPPGYTNSPYQSLSAFAGNPLLISPEWMASEGYLPQSLLDSIPETPVGRVNFQEVSKQWGALFHAAYQKFRAGSDLEEFAQRNAFWLDDYALFAALLEQHKGQPWNSWESGIARRQPAAIAAAKKQLRQQVGYHTFLQYLFFRQFAALRAEATARGIGLIGDLPIFVDHNSADVWANQRLFTLDEAGAPTVIAGVPPDYFSTTGQRWGNPLYRWERMKQEGYGWWIERLRAAFGLYDVVRIDHFRGFQAYWEIPATEATAINGRWVPGPGAALFRALQKAFGHPAIIAEDLGLITPEVETLRDRFQLPGMKVMQFAFSDSGNQYLPHNFTTPNCVAYTGTHDNDTAHGWWAALERKSKRFAQHYLGHRGDHIGWDLLRLAFASIANTAIFPVQDLLELDSDGRMNIPGSQDGNWNWRMEPNALTPHIAERLRELTETFGRLAPQ